MTDLPTDEPEDMNDADRAELDALLRFVYEARGFDFSGYKVGTLSRRIAKRMQATGTASYQEYLDVLQAEPAEVSRLLDTITINVSSFFRDQELWDALRDLVLPQLLEQKPPKGPHLRAWSAGCAAGQEPYSLAMLFAEAVGRENVSSRVKIYATDIDEAALTEARRAVYRKTALSGVPEALLARYFQPVNGDPDLLAFDPELRRCVIFGQHNLVSDAPISRIDLLLCRNTLMYFDSALQREVVGRLHFSVSPGGFLALGRVEMLLAHQGLFDLYHRGARIFRKHLRPRPGQSARIAPFDGGLTANTFLTDLAFEASTVAQIVVDSRGLLVGANTRARALFGLARSDVGRPFSELDLSYQPLELRSHIAAATAQRSHVTIKDVELNRSGQPGMHLDVVVTPLEGDGEVQAVLATFIDVSRHHALQHDLQEARRELEAAYQEVQSTNEELETTNEELQSTNEELETTNEELQSTIEELETTNEELRSTNEEFETMNDELRSVNDQLAARNRALRERTEELVIARRYFSSVLDSFDAAVLVVDANFHIRSWSAGAEELWGLRADEAEGRSVLTLDIGLPVDHLAAPMRTALSEPLGGRTTVHLAGHNRRGQPIACTVRCSPLRDDREAPGGVVLLIEVDRPENSN